MKGDLIVHNAAELVTCSGFSAKSGKAMADLNIIPDGAVVIQDGVITAVGPSNEVMAAVDPKDKTVINAAGKAVLPGLVDSHTHFLFAGHRPEEFLLRLKGASYLEILRQGGGILSTVQATRKATREVLKTMGLQRLDCMLAQGVTTVEGKSGYGLDMETELKQLSVMAELADLHPLDIAVTCMGAHALPEEYRARADDYLDFLCQALLPQVAARGLAEFCDVFCEKGVFSLDQSRRLLLTAKDLGLKPKCHVDEIEPLGGAEMAAEIGAVSADHLLRSSDQGIAALADAGVTAVLLPTSAFCMQKDYARARCMIDRGCAVALATDLNPGSCFSGSIPLLLALAVLNMHMTPAEAVTALTINGAAAIGRADQIGSLDVGKKGDLIILEFPSHVYLPYHTGVNCVETVIKSGCVVYEKWKGVSSAC